MSLFDFPRVNFKGTIELNPGTANNDDYAQQPGAALLPKSFGPPYAGQALGLIESKTVQARTFGMSDAAFIAWVQKAQTFDVSGRPGQTVQIIPAEWNYYGGMESRTTKAAVIAVIGVQTGPGQSYAKADPGVPATAVIGAALSYSGHITDVNSEGSPPATQFFIDSLILKNSTTTFLQGTAGFHSPWTSIQLALRVSFPYIIPDPRTTGRGWQPGPARTLSGRCSIALRDTGRCGGGRTSTDCHF